MASSNDVASTVNMIEIRAAGLGLPLFLCPDNDGLLRVPLDRLSIRFGYDTASLWLERDVLDPITNEVQHAMVVNTITDGDGREIYRLVPGKYKVYGLTNSVMEASTVLLTPRESSTCTLSTPRLVPVKIEPGLRHTIDLSQSSDDEHAPLVQPTKQTFKSVSGYTSSQDSRRSLHSPSLELGIPKNHKNILDSLRKLASMPGSKTILKKINYDAIRIVRVHFLPPKFDGNVVFVLPPPSENSSNKNSRSMDGMDKRHVWTKTMTTNISNNLGLTFRSSNCIGHLKCNNEECEYLERAGRTSATNETEFEGASKNAFLIGFTPPAGSTIVCKICNEPHLVFPTVTPRSFMFTAQMTKSELAFILASIIILSRSETIEVQR